MTSFECTYEQLKGHAAEFLKAIPTANLEELNAGMKCFNLFYLDAKYEQPHERPMAVSLLEYVQRQFLAAEKALYLNSSVVG